MMGVARPNLNLPAPIHPQADELLAALARGSTAGLLEEVHTALLRLVQADMGAPGARGGGWQPHLLAPPRLHAPLPPGPLLAAPARPPSFSVPLSHSPLCPPHPSMPGVVAEEDHATQFGPYATSTAAAAEGRGDGGRFFSAAHLLNEAWAWCARRASGWGLAVRACPALVA